MNPETSQAWRDARGAVFLEKLIVYAPLMLLFFMGVQLAEFSAAVLVVRRASSVAARATVVVLPDDPAFYDLVPPHEFEGARKDDVYLAAAMILSAAPQVSGDFTVQVSDPPIEDFGPIDVTVNATYHCGGIGLICGLDGIASLTSTTRQAYHRAEYAYEPLAAVGGEVIRGGRDAAAQRSGAGGGNPSTLARAARGGDPPGVGSGGDPPDGVGPGTTTGGRPDSPCDCPAESRAIIDSYPSRFVGWRWRGAGITGSIHPRGMVVSFYIKVGPCTPRGSVMFNRMMDHFPAAQAVKGEWTTLAGSGELTSNLDSYWRARDAGAAPEVAALATFTGTVATRRGFTQVHVITETRQTVEVEFRRPGS